jgi:hypothetical protein
MKTEILKITIAATFLFFTSQGRAAFVYDVDFGDKNVSQQITGPATTGYGQDFGAFERVYSGATFGPGNEWQVVANPNNGGSYNVDYITGWWQSPNGSYANAPTSRPDSVDLDGNNGNAGAIQTVLNIQQPGQVIIHFSLAGNPDAGAGIKTGTVAVGLGGATQDLSFTVTSANSDQNMGWLAETATFNVDQAGSYELTFASTSPLGNSATGYGLVIGNAVVPEPSTIIASALMLLPFGASTLRILRRNRVA